MSQIEGGLQEVANAIGVTLPENFAEGEARFFVLVHIAELPEEKQAALPEMIQKWFDSHVDNWDDYQAQAAAEAEARQTVEQVAKEIGTPVGAVSIEPPDPASAESVEPEKTTPITTSAEVKNEVEELKVDAGQDPAEPQRERKSPTSRKKPRVIKEGTALAAFLTVLQNEDPPQSRKVLLPKMIEELKKHKEDVDDAKATATFQAYISSSLNPKYAHDSAVLCSLGKDKVLLIKEFPYPPIVAEPVTE